MEPLSIHTNCVSIPSTFDSVYSFFIVGGEEVLNEGVGLTALPSSFVGLNSNTNYVPPSSIFDNWCSLILTVSGDKVLNKGENFYIFPSSFLYLISNTNHSSLETCDAQYFWIFFFEIHTKSFCCCLQSRLVHWKFVNLYLYLYAWILFQRKTSSDISTNISTNTSIDVRSCISMRHFCSWTHISSLRMICISLSPESLLLPIIWSGNSSTSFDLSS